MSFLHQEDGTSPLQDTESESNRLEGVFEGDLIRSLFDPRQTYLRLLRAMLS